MAVQKTMVIDSGLVAQMVVRLPRQTAEELQDQFGISMNTWVKLRKGEAIRQSVAERLLTRLEQGKAPTQRSAHA